MQVVYVYRRIYTFSLVIGACCLLALGCSSAARQRVATTMNAAAAGASASGNQVSTAKIMLFGGVDHRTYLGCLNCSEYATDSVLNQYGTYGNRYSSTSIWNRYSDYGSPYSLYSACNGYASDPPVIVDLDGRYYGRLTLNMYHPEIAAGTRFSEWLKTTVCEQ